MVYGVINKKEEKYYTYLKKVFDAINDKQKEYNWLVTNCECYPQNPETDKLFNNTDYCWISGEQLTEIVSKEDFQWVWGILSGFDKNVELSDILKYDLPREDDYSNYFKNPLELQHPLAHIEIVPFDSTFIMFLSKDKKIVDDFTKVYVQSEDLEVYNSK